VLDEHFARAWEATGFGPFVRHEALPVRVGFAGPRADTAADRTSEAYGQHVGAYGARLGTRGGDELALSEARAHDYAALEFKCHLKVDRG
jgi:hypothetical protein